MSVFSKAMTSVLVPSKRPIKVLIIGGSYAGLSAAVNLLHLSRNTNTGLGLSHQDSLISKDHEEVDLQVRVMDERDGFCTLLIIICVACSYRML
jgi:hypothetical protein